MVAFLLLLSYRYFAGPLVARLCAIVRRVLCFDYLHSPHSSPTFTIVVLHPAILGDDLTARIGPRNHLHRTSPGMVQVRPGCPDARMTPASGVNGILPGLLHVRTRSV